MAASQELLARSALFVAMGFVSILLGFIQQMRSDSLTLMRTTSIARLRRGRVELVGVARALSAPPPRAPFHNAPCAFAAWRIEQRRGKEWSTWWEGTTGPFLLEDASGAILVDPEGAAVEVEFARVAESTGTLAPPAQIAAFLRAQGAEIPPLDTRFFEVVFPEGGPVYALGDAQKDERGVEAFAARKVSSAFVVKRGSKAFLISASENLAQHRMDAKALAWLLGGIAGIAIGIVGLAVVLLG